MAPWRLHLLQVHLDPFIFGLGREAQQQRTREEPGLGGHETNGRGVHRDASGDATGVVGINSYQFTCTVDVDCLKQK